MLGRALNISANRIKCILNKYAGRQYKNKTQKETKTKKKEEEIKNNKRNVEVEEGKRRKKSW